jgi:hypothetical protein
MIEDQEIVALNTAYTALKDLAPDAIQRNINWLATRLGVSAIAKAPTGGRSPTPTETVATNNPDGQTASGEFEKFATSADFLSQINEPTDKERVLAIAAYIQKKEPDKELTGFSINKELKHIGHGVANITSAIQTWVDQRPQLMIQIRKTGTTKQAKKVYKVTEEGMKSVRKRLSQAVPQE